MHTQCGASPNKKSTSWSVVAQHGRICIGLPVSAEWAPIAKTLSLLARPNPGMLVEEQTDDGPAYSLSPAGHDKIG